MEIERPHPEDQPGFLESRLRIRAPLARAARKLFPGNWSFLLGEVALFSFVALLLSGIYLTFWYRPSIATIPYQGSYSLYRGRELPEAFVSVLHLSLDVPFGLVLRRVHHWAAHLFIASLLLHAARVYFTGAFRRPRELNFWIGLLLFVMAILNGFTGYALPFDMRGGAAIRMLLTTCESLPWVGGWVATFVFGGPFPGPYILSRLYIEHVLLGPAVIALLIGLHLYLVWTQTHTSYPAASRSNAIEEGAPAWPDQAARSGSLMFIVFGWLALLSAFIPVEALWIYGPFQSHTSHAPLDPDWFLMWIEGAYRLLPRQLDFHLIGAHFSNPFYGTVILSLFVLGTCALYPLIDQRLYKDPNREIHLLSDYRTHPFRTAFGISGVVFLVLLSIGTLNDRMAEAAGTTVPRINLVWGTLTLAAPAVVFVIVWTIFHLRRRKLYPQEIIPEPAALAVGALAFLARFAFRLFRLFVGRRS